MSRMLGDWDLRFRASSFHRRLDVLAAFAARMERQAGEQVTFLLEGGAWNTAPQMTHRFSILCQDLNNYRVPDNDFTVVLPPTVIVSGDDRNMISVVV